MIKKKFMCEIECELVTSEPYLNPVTVFKACAKFIYIVLEQANIAQYFMSNRHI